ncbi:MAG TPA: putative Ig domain-containing protein, partial [Fimbriimonas sp.]
MLKRFLLSIATLATIAHAEVYDLTTQFGNGANPSGTWSYGYSASFQGSFNLMTRFGYDWRLGPLSGAYWGPQDQNIWLNTTSSTMYGTRPGHISMHTGWGQEPVIVRWTAPEAATATISGYFGPGDAFVSRSKAVLHNNSVLFRVDNSTGTAAFSETVAVQAGDTIDFVNFNVYYNGNVEINATITTTPANEPPVLEEIGFQQGDEGSELSFVATATDPDLPDDTLTYSLVDAPAGAFIDAGTGVFAWTPEDDGLYSFTVKVTDSGGLSDEQTVHATIDNVVPAVRYLGPASGYVFPVATPVLFEGSFTDPGADSIWSAWWTFDKELPVLGDEARVDLLTPNSVLSPGAFAQKIEFALPGVYTATLSVQDKDGEQGTATVVDGAGSLPAFVVVYDPDGPSVTGGGWIHSPVGAMPGNPGASGRATFGFFSRYQKGASVPTGNAEFRFRAGDL